MLRIICETTDQSQFHWWKLRVEWEPVEVITHKTVDLSAATALQAVAPAYCPPSGH